MFSAPWWILSIKGIPLKVFLLSILFQNLTLVVVVQICTKEAFETGIPFKSFNIRTKCCAKDEPQYKFLNIFIETSDQTRVTFVVEDTN